MRLILILIVITTIAACSHRRAYRPMDSSIKEFILDVDGRMLKGSTDSFNEPLMSCRLPDESFSPALGHHVCYVIFEEDLMKIKDYISDLEIELEDK